jgi:ferredoxin
VHGCLCWSSLVRWRLEAGLQLAPLPPGSGGARPGLVQIEISGQLEVPLTTHFDDEEGGPPDLRALLAERPAAPRVHLYACGPTPMLDAFERISAQLGHGDNAHVERFAAVEHKPVADALKSFTVELVRSKEAFTVEPGQSIRETVLDAGVQVDHSFWEGVCGSCETRVLAGEPDRRDSILSAGERAGNKVMMLRVSGCKSATLALDL